MRILQILPELNVGGVETGTIDFAKYLVRHGHGSVVVSDGGKLVAELEKDGSKHYALPVHRKSLWTMLKMVKELRKIIISEKIDIVHARSRIPAWIAFFASRKTKATFVTTCHGYYGSRLFSQVMGWGKLVIVPSQVIGRHMIEDFRVPSENIRCIPRSVDLSKFQFLRGKANEKPHMVVSIVGRITPFKGHSYFLKAMAKVVRIIPYLKIWIIGNAPQGKEIYKQELEALVKRLGIENYVEFLGQRSDVPHLLSQTDILVMSSIVPESFGRVVLEAQAAGASVVATKIGGIVDIIDHDTTGLLVAPKDTEATAEAVIRLLQDKELRKRLTQNAQEKIKENFTLEHMATQTLHVYEELINRMNILVIKMSAMGDVILITGTLKALKEKFPKARIYCLVGKDFKKVLQNCPYIESLIIYDDKHKDKGWWRLWKLSKKLRRFHFDAVIDLQNNRRSHMLSFFSFPKESYGFDNKKWSFLLSHRIKNLNKGLPPVEHQFEVLASLGMSYSKDVKLELWPTKKDRQYVQELLDEEYMGNSKHIVGINISASLKWKTKNWPLEYIARLCDLLSQKNIRVILTGMDKDKPLAQEILSLTKAKPANWVGKTDIVQLAALIERCSAYVTPDSAPMHVAAAVNTPFVAFFGPTSSVRHLPPASQFFVFEKKPSCAPCYSSVCKIKTHSCMKDIKPEEVFKKIEGIMGGKN